MVLDRIKRKKTPEIFKRFCMFGADGVRLNR
nr:MAG TPA: FAM193 family C-terminal [Caudoviricetes sp.]